MTQWFSDNPPRRGLRSARRSAFRADFGRRTRGKGHGVRGVVAPFSHWSLPPYCHFRLPVTDADFATPWYGERTNSDSSGSRSGACSASPRRIRWWRIQATPPTSVSSIVSGSAGVRRGAAAQQLDELAHRLVVAGRGGRGRRERLDHAHPRRRRVLGDEVEEGPEAGFDPLLPAAVGGRRRPPRPRRGPPRRQASKAARKTSSLPSKLS